MSDTALLYRYIYWLACHRCRVSTFFLRLMLQCKGLPTLEMGFPEISDLCHSNQVPYRRWRAHFWLRRFWYVHSPLSWLFHLERSAMQQGAWSDPADDGGESELWVWLQRLDVSVWDHWVPPYCSARCLKLIGSVLGLYLASRVGLFSLFDEGKSGSALQLAEHYDSPPLIFATKNSALQVEKSIHHTYTAGVDRQQWIQDSRRIH